MTIFNIISLLGGLAMFLYGMHAMSLGLEKLSGGKLEKTIYRMTSNPLTSLLLGAGITIAIQSSSAKTVMLVGLVNSGVMAIIAMFTARGIAYDKCWTLAVVFIVIIMVILGLLSELKRHVHTRKYYVRCKYNKLYMNV